MGKVKIENSTKDIVVSFLSDKGTANTETISVGVVAEAQVETLSFLQASEAQVETITIPATAAATQADYIMLYNVAGESAAVWLDIDAAGTEPTGANYVGADYQIMVSIAGGSANTVNAAAFKSAVEAVVDFDAVSFVDNADGTLTFTQTSLGDCDDATPHNADDSGAGSLLAAVDNDGISGMLQGDYVFLTNQEGVTVAVWFDIDADGTPPVGADYVASDYQVEVDIATGDTAASNAAAFKTALDLELNFTNVTITDNLDGSVEIAQDLVGACDDAVPHNADDSGDGSITATLDNDGVTGVDQADYVVVSNAEGETIALWVDIDADGTEPTGDAYVDSDYQSAISLTTGETLADSSAALYAAIIAEAEWMGGVNVTDNGDGTVTVAQSAGGVVAAADPHNAGDTTLGNITATTVTTGTAGDATLIDYIPKAGLRIIQDVLRNKFHLITIGDRNNAKGNEYVTIEFDEVSSPVEANLTALIAQIVTWKDS